MFVVLLSSKSSGSSAFQSYLHKNFGFHLMKAKHHEHETLLWTKAASAFDYHQDKMYRSVVPYSKQAGSSELNHFAKKNLEAPVQLKSKADFFHLVHELYLNHSSTLLEKSPHHLFNYSNLQLLQETKSALEGKVDFKFIGLVRNPMDTIYSAWKRWKFIPKDFEHEWVVSYKNLLKFREQYPITIMKYEDVAVNDRLIDDYLVAQGYNVKSANLYRFKSSSLAKWKSSPLFKHQLGTEARALAEQYGYDADDLDNKNGPDLGWHLRLGYYKMKYRLSKLM